MTKKNNQIQITQRDIDLLFFLHSVKIATIDQIGREAYPDLGKWGLYKRLQRLEKQGYLQGIRSSETNFNKVYNITRKSLKKYFPIRDVKRNEIKSDSIKHDIGLVDIRHALCRSNKVTTYIPENSLQTWPTSHIGEVYTSFVRCNSDAALELTVNNVQIYFAIEYEISLKQDIRYRDTLRRYYLENNISRVLYILESQNHIKHIIKAEKEMDITIQPKFFYTTKEQLVQNEKLIFTNWKNQVIEL